MGKGRVTILNNGIEYQCSFFVVPRKGPAFLGMSDCEWLQPLSINCQTTSDQHNGRQINEQTNKISP